VDSERVVLFAADVVATVVVSFLLDYSRTVFLRRKLMLYTLAVVLLILWLLGLVSGYTVGAFIHVLLVIAVVLVLVQLITGRRPAL
jgi:hypothetical protein